MSDMLRTGSKFWIRAGRALLLAAVLPVVAVSAQEPVQEEPEATAPAVPTAEPEAPAPAKTGVETAPAPTAASTAPAATESGEALTRAQKRQAAKEQRIAEYLQRKEERRREREGLPPAAPAPQTAGTSAAPPPAVGTAAAPAATAAIVAAPTPEKRSSLPRNLAKAQESVRRSSLGESLSGYLDMVDRQEASPQQLGAFANFLADNGMDNEALAYYDTALTVDKSDPVLWLNKGTLHRKREELGPAAEAYKRALQIDPNYAFAHYNLGAVYDARGKYKEAVESYRMALSLDPALGDPLSNPQAANNERLLAVKLMLYRELSGSMGLGLVDLPGGAIAGQAPTPPGTEGDR